MMMKMVYDLLILGAGPAGLCAAVYALRYELDLIIIGKDMGKIADAEKVENYMGFPSISGQEIAQKFTDHAKKLGGEIIREEIKKIEKRDDVFVVKAGKKEYKSKSLIYALGGEKRKLDVPQEKKFRGKGISYCATCDGAFYKDMKVAVAGGANSAVASALHLSKIARKVYIVYRRDELRAFPHFVDKVKEKENIEVIYKTNIVEVKGEDVVKGVVLENVETKERKELKVDGVFVEFGYEPNYEIAEDLGVEISREGRVKIKEDGSTNIKGFFAAGDITTGSNKFNQLVAAAAEGAIAARSVHKFISEAY